MDNNEYISGWADAATYVGLSEPSIRRAPDFPEPIRLSPRRCAWLRSELDTWLAKRPKGIVHQTQAHKTKSATGRKQNKEIRQRELMDASGA